MPTIGATMEWDNPDKASAFARFKRKCELLFNTYHKAVEGEGRVDYILLWLGDEGDDIYKTFTWDVESDSKDFSKVLEKFEMHFQPMASHRLHRYHLMQMRQGNQPVDEYLKEMKTVASKCKFRDSVEVEDRMLDQLILGCNAPEVQKSLIGRNENFKLDEAAKIARAHEATRQQMNTLNKTVGAQSSVNAVQGRQQNRRQYPQQNRSNRDNYRDDSERKTRENERSPRERSNYDPNRNNRNYERRSEQNCDRNRDQNRRESYNGRSESYSDNDRGRRRKRGHRGGRGRRSQSRGRSFHSSEQMEPDDDEHSEYNEPPNQAFASIALDTVSIHKLQVDAADTRDQVFATLTVHKFAPKRTMPLQCKVDTGADGNIMPISTYRHLYPDQIDAEGTPKVGTLQSCSTVLTAYGGTRIAQFGKVGVPCSYREMRFTCNFYVADVPGPVILGLPTCRALKLVVLNCSVARVKTSPPDVATGSTPASNGNVSNHGQRRSKKAVTFADQRTDRSDQNSVEYIPSDMPLSERPPIKSKEQLREMYPECFDSVQRHTRYFGISIDRTVTPVIHAPRRVPIEVKDRLKDKLEQMEEEGIIAQVTGPTDWVNSLVVREKPDGSLCVCLDPTDLNRAIKRVHYPTPTVEEITPKLSGSTVFSKLDAKDGYWHISLDEPSSLLTTFNSPFGRFRFLKLPFGLKLSQDVFQMMMDETYTGCKGAAGIADDIQVYGEGDQNHDLNLHEAMERTRNNGVKLNFKKCAIKQPEVTFFGNIYSAHGVRPDPEKVQAIKDIKAPQNKTDLHTFLGMVSYLRQFIKDLSDHTASLRELLKESVDFDWSEAHQAVFVKVKELITEDVTLAFYDRNKPVTLQVDASMLGLGATLMQEGRPIAYASKSLTPTESRYANIERELLAVVFGCTKFHTYLYGRSFTVESDHKPLEQISRKNLTKAPPRLQRMLMQLQPYDFELMYRPGKEVVIADALSRLSPSDDITIPGLEVRIHDMVTVKPTRMTALQEATEEDEDLQLLKQQILKGWPFHIKALSPQLRPYWSVRDDLYIQDGLLMMGQRIIVPKTQRDIILSQIHNGHLGMEKCKLRAKACVWWPGIYADIERTVASCPSCQTFQKSQCKEPMISSDVPPRPWHTIGADLFYLNNQCYLLVSDYYSKFPFVRRLYSQGSKAVISAMSGIFSEQGIPEKLVCDNGSQLVSHAFTSFANSIGMEVVTSSPHYPRGHGLIERHVQSIKRVMAKCAHSGSDINMSLLALRATPLTHSLASPAELLNSRRYRTDLPTKIATPISHENTMQQLQNAQSTSSEYYNQHSRALPELQRGQQVRVQNPSSKTWSPAKVIGIASTPRSYVVEKEDGGILRRNRQHLRNSPEERSKSPSAIPHDSESSTSPQMTVLDARRKNIPCDEPVYNSPSRSPPSTPRSTRDDSRPGTTTRSGRRINKPQRLDL